MGPLTFERLGVTLLDEARLCHVVAIVALLLRVTALANSRLTLSFRPVQRQKAAVVTNERAGHELFDFECVVTGTALPAVELLLVLVTLEAAVHRGEKRALLPHHAAVARHALTADAAHLQVSLVVELDLVGRRRWLQGWTERPRSQGLGVIAMTGGASRHVGALGAWAVYRAWLRLHCGHRLWQRDFRIPVAAGAGQASPLARLSARDPGQVQLVREPRRRPLVASENHGKRECDGEQNGGPTVATHRAPPRKTAAW